MTLSALNLSQACQQRIRLQEELKLNLSELKNAFKHQFSSVSLIETARIVDNLCVVNTTIEKRKEEILKRRNCCGLANAKVISTSTYISLAINTLAWLIVSGFSIYNLATSDEESDKKRDLTELVVFTFVLFLNYFVQGIQIVGGDKGHFELLARVTSLEKRGEEHFNQFLAAFDDFKRSQNEKKQTNCLANCIHRLDKTLEDDFEQFPSRDYWISYLVDHLPNTHPIKKKLLELKASAMRMHESSTLTDSGSSTVSLSDSTFKGEKKPFHQMIKIPKTSKKELLISKRTQERSFKEFQKEWSQIEKNLKTQVSCFKIQGVWLVKDCTIAKKRKKLPQKQLEEVTIGL